MKEKSRIDTVKIGTQENMNEDMKTDKKNSKKKTPPTLKIKKMSKKKSTSDEPMWSQNLNKTLTTLSNHMQDSLIYRPIGEQLSECARFIYLNS